MGQDKVILSVGGSSSVCGACRRTCDPYEASHERRCGYDQHEGCGAVYTHVTSSMAYPGVEERVRGMRPDLTYLDGAVVA